MPGVIASIPKFQFSANGVPMVGGTLTVYVAGTTTLTGTWQDSALSIANTNPIVLDARGECVLWLDAAVVYKFVLKNVQGVIQWTQDNISSPAALRLNLSATTGASLVGWIRDDTGAVATTLAKLLGWQSTSVFNFMTDAQIADCQSGAATINATAPIQAANTTGKQVVFYPGTYLLQSNTTFAVAPKFLPGAVLKVRGCIVTFSAGIEAGWHTIFDTTDDFVTTLQAATSVVIRSCNVKADWFCARVLSQEDILTIADQTNNLSKAYRAAVGNYSTPVGTNWNTQFPDGVLELGHGYYRIDGTFAWGKQVGAVYYKVTGFKMVGKGVNASYLVRTNMASKDYVMFGAFYTGELTVADAFKVTAYNPAGATDAQKYSSAAKAGIFLQGDSLRLGEIWVSGMQTPVTDTNGLKRNGVGIQFSSCIDTFFETIFTEYCTTAVAFCSSLVSGNNLELYTSGAQAIGLGCFVADWPDTQSTSSTVNITNIQARACNGYGISVLENGALGDFNITTSVFDGFSSEFGTYVGTTFCNLLSGTSLVGSISNSAVNNFRDSTFKLNGTASLGRVTAAFSIRDLRAKGQTYSIAAGFICASNSSYANVLTDGVSLDQWSGVLLQAPQTGNIRMLNTSLSAYQGQSDAGAGRQLFVSQSSASIQIIGVIRNSSDTVQLNQFGYAASGNVLIDIDNLFNAVRGVAGAAIVKMPSKLAFA